MHHANKLRGGVRGVTLAIIILYVAAVVCTLFQTVSQMTTSSASKSVLIMAPGGATSLVSLLSSAGPSEEETCRRVAAYLELMEQNEIIFNCTTTIDQCRESVGWYGVNKRMRNKAGFWVPGQEKKLWLKAWTGEFGAEMDLPMPWAYTLHKCGLLHQTNGCGELQVYYFFSKNHAQLRSCTRLSVPKQFMGTHIRFQSAAAPPRHPGMLDVAPSVSLWPPPLAAHCRALDAGAPLLAAAAGRPVLVIANKYSREFDGPPLVFYGVDVVERMIAAFEDACPGGNVVYMRARAKGARGMVDDAQEEADLVDRATGQGDLATVRQRRGAVVVNDLWARHAELSANEVQCRAFARARCFASVQGGIQHVLRYFGGRQMIFHPPTRGYETYSASESVMGGGTLYYASNTTQGIVDNMRGFFAPGGRCACAWVDGADDPPSAL